MFCKIRGFICTTFWRNRIGRNGFCRTKTSANKIRYFTKHCWMIFFYTPVFTIGKVIWVAARQNQQNEQCVQRRLRSACAFPPSLIWDFRCPHQETLGPELPTERTAKIRIRHGLMVLSLLYSVLTYIKYCFFIYNFSGAKCFNFKWACEVYYY